MGVEKLLHLSWGVQLRNDCRHESSDVFIYGQPLDYHFGHFVQDTLPALFRTMEVMGGVGNSSLLVRWSAVTAQWFHRPLLSLFSDSTLDKTFDDFFHSNANLCLNRLVAGMDFFASADHAPLRRQDARTSLRRRFVDFVYAGLKLPRIDQQQKDDGMPIEVTVIDRTSAKRAWHSVAQLARALEDVGNVVVHVERFEELDFIIGLWRMQTTQVMLGVMGSGFQYASFMASNSVAVVLLPEPSKKFDPWLQWANVSATLHTMALSWIHVVLACGFGGRAFYANESSAFVAVSAPAAVAMLQFAKPFVGATADTDKRLWFFDGDPLCTVL